MITKNTLIILMGWVWLWVGFRLGQMLQYAHTPLRKRGCGTKTPEPPRGGYVLRLDWQSNFGVNAC